MAEKLELSKIIQENKLVEFVQMDDYLQIVNSNPPKSWIKDHPTAKGVRYLPIDKVEMLLTMMYQSWYVNIIETKQIMNSVVVTVRLHYKHPINDRFEHMDGVGAVAVQTSRGASAADMSAIVSDGVMKAMPAAESYAIKDAAEKIGKVFGKDLNRKDTLAFSPTYGTDENKKAVGVIKSDDEMKEAVGKLNTSKDILEYMGTLSIEEKRMVAPFVDERIRNINDARN